MNQDRRRSQPSWRVADARAFRLEWVLLPLIILSLLLFEVWRSSKIASLSFEVSKATAELKQASTVLDWTEAGLERDSNRSETSPVATAIGLRPVDPTQIVALPAEYLEPESSRMSAGAPTLMAAAGRALQSLVPDATARGRQLN